MSRPAGVQNVCPSAASPAAAPDVALGRRPPASSLGWVLSAVGHGSALRDPPRLSRPRSNGGGGAWRDGAGLNLQGPAPWQRCRAIGCSRRPPSRAVQGSDRWPLAGPWRAGCGVPGLRLARGGRPAPERSLGRGFPSGFGRPETRQARSILCRRGVFLTRWNSESIWETSRPHSLLPTFGWESSC